MKVGFVDLENIVHVGTDSSAAKSFVGRQGLGKMKHLEIRDLWLQKEVHEGSCGAQGSGNRKPVRLGDEDFECS